MKAVFLTGSHPRHAEFARQLQRIGCLAGLVIAQRESHVPEPPANLLPATTHFFRHHFACRAKSEKTFFGDVDFPTNASTETLKVPYEHMNADSVHQFVQRIDPDLLLSYGIGMLTNTTLASCKHETWNIHGGLSPWYRGAITHFWPSYLLEPQMTGMTVHELTQDLDGGAVIHQTGAELVRGDGLHDLACRTVRGLVNELPKLMEFVSNRDAINRKRQTTSGRIWRGSDWRPDHLRVIYETYEDRIVDHYLDGQFEQRDPRIHRQF